MERVAFKIISPQDIAQEFPYQTRYRPEDEKLTRAVALYGVIQPLLVTKSPSPRPGEGRPPEGRASPVGGVRGLQLISGHQRFQAVCRLGLRHVPVLEIQNPAAGGDLFILALLSNFNHALTDLDKAWALRRAVETFHWREEDVLDEIFPCLGLAASPHLLKEYLDIARLEPALLDSIADRCLPFRGARRLTRFSREDQITLAQEIVLKISLTTNQWLKTGEWLSDLLKSGNRSLSALLQVQSLRSVLNSPRGDKRQRAEKFFQAVRNLRFPHWVEQERRFENFSREIEKEFGNVTLEVPPHFEGEGFVLRAKIRRPDSLDEVVELVRRRRESLNSLFDIVL